MHRLLETRRVCLLLFQTNTHTQDALSGFKEHLWEQGLGDLMKDGLLVLDFRTDSRWQSERWPLTLMPDEQFTLPSAYSREARGHASEDLVRVLQAWGVEALEGRSMAMGIAATVDGPKEMYMRLAGIKFNLIEFLKAS